MKELTGVERCTLLLHFEPQYPPTTDDQRRALRSVAAECNIMKSPKSPSKQMRCKTKQKHGNLQLDGLENRARVSDRRMSICTPKLRGELTHCGEARTVTVGAPVGAMSAAIIMATDKKKKQIHEPCFGGYLAWYLCVSWTRTPKL